LTGGGVDDEEPRKRREHDIDRAFAEHLLQTFEEPKVRLVGITNTKCG